MQKTMSKAKRRSTPAADPTAIPAIAPPERLLLLLLPPVVRFAVGGDGDDAGGGGGGGDGGGDGDGVGEVSFWHERRGPPHRDIPRNELACWDLIPRGIDPVRLLYEMLKLFNLEKLISGISPEKLLFWRSKVRMPVKLLNPGEIPPEKLFSERSSRTSPEREKRELGSSPENRLFRRMILLRFRKEPMSDGRAPESPLNRRLRTRRAVRFVKVPAGIAPRRPEPGRRSTETRLSEQLTPRHEHGEALAFHRRTERPTAARRASSAAASPARSGAPPGRRERRRRRRRSGGDTIPSSTMR